MFWWCHSESKMSARKAQILLYGTQNIFPKSYEHDEHESNIQYFIWGAILKKAPFLFENSIFFTKSVRFWTIFEKRKGAFFFGRFSIVYCSKKANLHICDGFRICALRFRHAQKKKAPFQNVVWDFKMLHFWSKFRFLKIEGDDTFYKKARLLHGKMWSQALRS